MGCGATPLASGRATIDVGGTMREYILKVPDGYDASKPYKLIFGWHWRGGVANDVATGSIIGGPYYGLESRAAGSAIFVAPEGIDMGWANTNGRDIAFLHSMLDPSARIDDKYVSVMFQTESGKVVTGMIVAETPDVVKIIENPLASAKPTELPRGEILGRKKSNVSLMPKGLLDKLTKEEILDLVAYVAAAGDPKHKVYSKGHDHSVGAGHAGNSDGH
jgi:putative heme-binding domain-containing protein